MKRLAILISNAGIGTNLQTIIDGVESGKINAKIAVVISDKEDAFGLQRAKKHNIPTEINPDKANLLSLLKKYNIDYVCLGGWKQIITDDVMKAYQNEQVPSFGSKILNTHPGLIPDTMDGVVKNPDGTNGLWNKGKFTEKALQNFLDQNATYAGCSNHFLTKEFDFGPVLGRCFEKIRKGDTVESLYKRLKKKENQLYVDVLAKLCRKVNLTVLVVDGGGRGAVLVDKYAQSKKVGKILAVPGNDLMQINTKKKVITYPNLKTTSVPEILEIVKKEKVDLVDVAQDNAVEVGLVDGLIKHGINAFGPTRLSGQIEWDKAWSKEFMNKYKIPSPEYNIFNSEKDGINFAQRNPNKKWFVKASGLAEGKGAFSGSSVEETINAIKQMSKFGPSGEIYLLEEWLVGEEFSAFALCDGSTFKVVGYAQDHKRVFDRDSGPNTGGMGCVSNPLIVDEKIKIQVEEIFKKVIQGMKKEGRQYKGVLYLGGIVVNGKVFVIEFNARWGDPEAQVILPSIKNDLVDLADAIIMGKLNKAKIEIDKKIRVVVAATSKGYPNNYSKVKGKKISGIEKAQKMGVKIYGAGVRKIGEDYVVNGGRVLYIMADGKDVIEAREKVYSAVKLINIEGDNLHYRSDIGWRDLERWRKSK